ncbi:DUF2642 domain-containing protein [Cytobacillus gottheilii]|uniref:DUF2642 domain-containing protein n=1 Tax=Cytobacillus gottheilii TaxID=859144 RepID=UPI002494EC62|nr:DUF2642 domain-containing protein [Cytobacillus gottheilii]
MRLNVGNVVAIPSQFGLGFVTNLLNCILNVVNPANPDNPPSSPGFVRELEDLIGRQVLVNTAGGPVTGLLVLVRADYAVLNAGTSFVLIPFARLQGITAID